MANLRCSAAEESEDTLNSFTSHTFAQHLFSVIVVHCRMMCCTALWCRAKGHTLRAGHRAETLQTRMHFLSQQRLFFCPVSFASSLGKHGLTSGADPSVKRATSAGNVSRGSKTDLTPGVRCRRRDQAGGARRMAGVIAVLPPCGCCLSNAWM